MENRERRFVPSARITVRAAGDDEDSRALDGEGAVFNQRAVIAGMFEEEIAPGAFDDVLDDDIVIEFNHDPNYVLGRTSADTAQLSADDGAFRYEVPEVPAAREDVLEAVRLGNVRGSSFSFQLPEDGSGEEWTQPHEREDRDLPLRRIVKIERVFDVGPVTHPAYEETSVSARAKSRAAELTDAERRAAGGGEDAAARQRIERERLRLAEAQSRAVASAAERG